MFREYSQQESRGGAAMTTRKRVLPQGWYPGSPKECVSEIDGFLQGFDAPQGEWLGGVAPHAGWYFSGRAAARVVKTLSGSTGIDRVVVYGGHLPGGRDPIIYTEDSWETPLGPLTMDPSLATELVAAKAAVPAGGGFADNTVEVQLPIVKRFFPDIPVVAVHSPASERAIELAGEICGILENKGLKAVHIGSADLTHYGPNYGFSPKGTGPAAVEWVREENDRSLIDKAVAMDTVGLLQDSALRQNTCSAGPIASVMTTATRRGIEHGRLLEYYTSYDVMPGSSFVGYAAIVY